MSVNRGTFQVGNNRVNLDMVRAQYSNVNYDRIW